MPSDFDPDEYVRRYPDVAMSGLSPRDHYLLFGKLLNRQAPAPRKAEQPTSEPKATKAAAPAPQESALQVAPPATPAPRTELAPRSTGKPKVKSPIVDRPAEFSADDCVVQAAPKHPGVDEHGRVPIEALVSEAPQPIAAATISLRRMLRPDDQVDTRRAGIGGDQFRNGPHRIENAWITSDSGLRLIIADDPGRHEGWRVRALQVDGADGAQLRLLGTGALLPKRGPSLVELPLSDPLLPLLLELRDGSENVRDLTLLPFPSLLPGGLHAAELRAMQLAPNPMQALWSLSEALLNDLQGSGAARRFAISEIAGADAMPEGLPAFDAVERWLSAVFDFAREGEVTRRSGDGGSIKLPSNSIPTIATLVARQELASRPSATLPFLVTDAQTLRPRWAVALPTSWDCAAAPTLKAAGTPFGSPTRSPAHAAIAFRSAAVASVPSPAKQSGTGPLEGSSAAIVLTVTDPARTERIVADLQAVFGAKLDLLVKLPASPQPFREKLEEILGAGGWRPSDWDLVDIAAETDAELLLTLDDRIDGLNAAVFSQLGRMIALDGVASASCVLLQEASIKKTKVLQPASGGLFPSAISLATSPSVSFAEPDVREALPGAIYPVAANTIHLTLWRAKAVAELRGSLPFTPPEALDIALGLGLAQRGFANLCTTVVAAKIAGPYIPRDVIDPIGQSRLGPADWQALLDRVTVLRQLF